MQSKATSISSYLKSLGKNERAVIETLDQLVRTAAPGATGSMKYGMPTYDVSGRTIAFNAQKNYYSFYADPAVVKRYRAELGPVDCGKSCIRFRKLEEVSLDALKKIVLEHAK